MNIEIKCEGADSLDLYQLTPLEDNPKDLEKEEFEALKESILTEGFCFPLRVWKESPDKLILGGNTTYKVLKHLVEVEKHSLLGKLPISYVSAKNIKEAKRKALRDMAVYGKINKQAFFEFSSSFNIDTETFKNTPLPDFDKLSYIDEFFKDHTDKEEIQDDVPEIDKSKIKTKLGDIYELGNHRLMCGDSTIKNNTDRLSDGEVIDMVFTDPPYGMNVVKPDGNSGGERKGSLVGKSNRRKAKLGIYKPITGDDKPFDPSPLLGLAKLKIIWGANHFSEKLPTSPHWVVWNKEMPEGSDFSGAELAWTNIDKKAVKVFKFVWAGMTRQGDRKDELIKRVHPTQKPVGLFVDILNHYEPKSVIDTFGGSGSTLIACEKTNRKCFMMELDEYYCDIIVSRWCKYTGKNKIKLNGKEIVWQTQDSK